MRIEQATFEKYGGKRKGLKGSESAVDGWLEFNAPMTKDLAEVLGCLAWFEGLDEGIEAPKLKRVADDAIASFIPLNAENSVLDLKGVGVKKFEAKRTPDGPRMSFRIGNRAPVHRALMKMCEGGGWAGHIEIEASQGELFAEEDSQRAA